MLTFLLGIANVLSGGQSVGGLPASFAGLGGSDWGSIPSALVLALATALLVAVALQLTRFGLYVYGIGGSKATSRFAGVPVVRYEVLAYTVCGLLAGAAGIVLASRLSVGQAESGTGYELLSIATAVIGGTAIGGGVGTVSGAILGTVLIQVLTTGLDIAGVGDYVQAMITGGVIVAAGLVGLVRGARLGALRRLLAPGGRFVFTVVHPCFNTNGVKKVVEEEVVDGEVVERYSVQVSRYLSLGPERSVGIVGQPASYYQFNRPLGQLLGSVFAAGFVLDGLEEVVSPPPADAARTRRPFSWARFQEIPPFLVARARPLARGG
jgi:hypothetical protein